MTSLDYLWLEITGYQFRNWVVGWVLWHFNFLMPNSVYIYILNQRFRNEYSIDIFFYKP